MRTTVRLDGVYAPSEDIVARKIAGELLIVPLTAGVGSVGEELFSLNKTGRLIWDKLDGKRTLRDIVAFLSARFDSPAGKIEQDVKGLIRELLKRRIVVEVP